MVNAPDYFAAKRDAGKGRPTLIPWGGLRAVIAVAEFGIRKGYAPHSWRTVPDARERYTEALGRHFIDCMEYGPWSPDSESGLPVLAHVAWNALALLALGEDPERREREK